MENRCSLLNKEGMWSDLPFKKHQSTCHKLASMEAKQNKTGLEAVAVKFHKNNDGQLGW